MLDCLDTWYNICTTNRDKSEFFRTKSSRGAPMATWITHLMIANRVLKIVSELDKHCFCVGNIAPDCNVENEDWSQFVPSRKITH